jgi:DNA-binding transcriptional MocR family regulator
MANEETLYLRIADGIAASIRAGVLARGERLPSLRDVARQHGVSLSTAVQAYRALEDMRHIETRPRSGHFVAARPAQPPEPGTTRPPADSRRVDVQSVAAEVMRYANEPGFVSFGAACPSSDLFSHERVRRAVSRAVQRHRATLCEYPLGHGHESLRRAIARHALRLGCRLQPRDIVVTNSCLEAITLCLRTVTQPGDVVALESPTYFGFLEILQSLHLRALEIPTHPRTGISLDALELAFDTQPVKAVVLVPTLSNPLGASMTLPDRRRLAQMLQGRGIAMIEDVLYNDLAEQDDRRRAVKSFDTEGNVMLCGSFSKTLAPGLRLGWVEAGRWCAPLQRLKSSTSGGQTTVLELAMADLLTQVGNESAYRQLRRTVAARVDEARSVIAQSFPRGTRVTDPAGGYILWVELPPEVDSVALFNACLVDRICIAPGAIFSSSDRYRHCIRLGVGGRWDDEQRAALRRIGAIAGQLAELEAPALAVAA